PPRPPPWIAGTVAGSARSSVVLRGPGVRGAALTALLTALLGRSYLRDPAAGALPLEEAGDPAALDVVAHRPLGLVWGAGDDRLGQHAVVVGRRRRGDVRGVNDLAGPDHELVDADPVQLLA